MDNKAYLWLFKNINKYNFNGQQANSLKNAICSLPVTEDSLNSDVIMEKVQQYYSRFINLFYNNIYGYKNGFANKPITSAELDCYFIDTYDGLVPIGYYKIEHPAEVVYMANELFEKSRNELIEDRNKLVVGWHEKLKVVTEGCEKIKSEFSPNYFKAIAGFILALLIVVLAAVSIFRLNVIGVLLSGFDGEVIYYACNSIPVLGVWGFALPCWIGGLLYSLLLMLISLLLVIFSIKEILLVGKKKKVKYFSANVAERFAEVEQRVNADISITDTMLEESARQGNNLSVGKSAAVDLINDTEAKISMALTFVTAPKRKRRGVSLLLIIAAVLLSAFMIILYIQPLASFIKGVLPNSDPGNTNGGTITIYGTGGQTDSPDEPKVSSYNVYKSDCNWTEAMIKAENDGGYLVSVNDSDEFKEICALAEQQNLYVFWVGARRSALQDWDEVYWLDGTAVTYTPWYGTEPTYQSETGEDELFLMAFKVNGVWYFNDAQNDVAEFYRGKMGYIVEIEE